VPSDDGEFGVSHPPNNRHLSGNAVNQGLAKKL
jgi:hypothetical protein